MKTAQAEIARMRRNLSLIEEEAPIQRAPNPVSIFCADAQGAPVPEPEVFKPSQRIPAADRCHFKPRHTASRLCLIRFCEPAKRDDRAVVAGDGNEMLKIHVIAPIR